MGVFDIGLKSEGTFGVLVFGIGDIIARLKHTGKIPSTKHWLKIAVRGTLKYWAHSTINLVGISPGYTDLFVSRVSSLS